MEIENLERLLSEVQSLASLYAQEARSFKEGSRPDLASVLLRCERDLLKVVEKTNAKPKAEQVGSWGK